MRNRDSPGARFPDRDEVELYEAVKGVLRTEHRDTKFTLDLRNGQIWTAGPRRPERPVEDIPDELWTEIGELDRVTGRSTRDLEKASARRPLS